jgi:Ca2+-binding RTX toxin-like protein
MAGTYNFNTLEDYLQGKVDQSSIDEMRGGLGYLWTGTVGTSSGPDVNTGGSNVFEVTGQDVTVHTTHNTKVIIDDGTPDGEGVNKLTVTTNDPTNHDNLLIVLGHSDTAVYLQDGGMHDTVLGGQGAMETVFGGAGSDSVVGGLDSSDTFIGGDGNDTLIGGSYGYNYLEGDAGKDSLVGGEGGYDYLAGGAGSDTLIAGSGGGSTLLGGAGNDLIDGSYSSGDTLNSGAGADSIVAGRDDTIVSSGLGTDTIDFSQLGYASHDLGNGQAYLVGGPQSLGDGKYLLEFSDSTTEHLNGGGVTSTDAFVLHFTDSAGDIIVKNT